MWTKVIAKQVIKAKLTDYFWQKGLHSTPITICLFGHVRSDLKPPRIEWTSSEFVMGTNWWSQRAPTVIPNPPVSERLRQIPWEILQEDDGMFIFRRGAVGVSWHLIGRFHQRHPAQKHCETKHILYTLSFACVGDP